MEVPEKYAHKWIILVLGKHDRLSGKQIYEEAKKEKECSKLVLPTYGASYYKYLAEIEKSGFIRQVEEKRVRGTLERFYSLTQKGIDAFSEIRDTFPIEDMIPSFIEQHLCPDCEAVQVEECWGIKSKDLEVVLRDMHDAFPKSHSVPLNLLKQEFKTPGHLQEFTFWLLMLKLPKKRLKDKFANQMKQLGLEIT
jgi:DNA-binding PadR family transcriptional regulator